MMDRSDVADLAEKRWRRFLESPPKDVWNWAIRTTSGTVGMPILFINPAPEEAFVRFAGSRCVLLAAGSRSIRVAYVRNTRVTVSDSPLRILCLDNADLASTLSPLLSDLGPDYIYGIPSFVMRAFAYTKDSVSDSVERVCLTGERMSAHLKEYFSSHFPGASVSMEYIVSEVGHVGVSCPHLPLNQYHPTRGVLVRVENEDEHGVGNLIVSKEEKSSVPVKDYRVGDTVRISRSPCACGAVVKIEHFGRSGVDYMKLHGALIRREEFDRVADTFKGKVVDYRAEIGETNEHRRVQGRIILHILLRDGVGTESLAQEMARAFEKHVFATPTQTIADLVAKGVFVPITVRFAASAFSVRNKDVKLVSARDTL